MTRATIAGLERLKAIAVQRARRALEAQHRRYVSTFRAALKADGLDAAIACTASMLAGHFTRWPEALAALFDLELGMNKLREAYRHLEASASEAGAGALFAYHLDFWIFRADATLDRLEAALKKCMRLMLAPDGFRAAESEIEADIAKLKSIVAPYRNGLAHGLGMGVDGITEYWPSLLALPDPAAALGGFNATIIEGVARSVDDLETRARWLGQIREGSVHLFADIDALCGRVARAGEIVVP